LLGEKVNALVATIPGQPTPDRLVTVNPKFFDLHKLTAALKKIPDLTAASGIRFLGDDASTSSEYVSKSVVAYIASYQQIRSAMLEQAKRAKVELIESKTLEIHGADESGVDVTLNGQRLRPRMLIVGGDLPVHQRKILGLPEQWDHGVLHRYTFLCSKNGKQTDSQTARLIPMSLDLGGKLRWAWMLCGAGEFQVAVEQPIDSVQKDPPQQLLSRWIDVLMKHQVIKPGAKPLDVTAAESIDLPLAGALVQEGVANRTLLIGPAGGFYNACAEDIYPTCWSAIFAAGVAVKALQATHLQDALGAYRQTWGATLGDYLRGPQENLRFLLPLVYRNAVMTARMGEAIMSGESVVR
jgi:hypothetical protein